MKSRNIEKEVESQFAFKPQISQKAKSKPSKTVEELWRGDIDKVTQKIQQKKEEMELKLMQEATFKPSISRSTSILNYSPKSHVERLERKSEQTKKKMEGMLLRECT